jgi:hypothetical protein
MNQNLLVPKSLQRPHLQSQKAQKLQLQLSRRRKEGHMSIQNVSKQAVLKGYDERLAVLYFHRNVNRLLG